MLNLPRVIRVLFYYKHSYSHKTKSTSETLKIYVVNGGRMWSLASMYDLHHTSQPSPRARLPAQTDSALSVIELSLAARATSVSPISRSHIGTYVSSFQGERPIYLLVSGFKVAQTTDPSTRIFVSPVHNLYVRQILI